MIYYFLLLCVVCLDFLLEKIVDKCLENKKTNNILIRIIKFIFKYRIITIIALVLISSLRSYSVGLDTKSYLKMYKKALANPKSTFTKPYGSSFEVGFHAIVSLFAVAKFDFRVLLLFTSLFFSVCLILFVNKYSKDKMMSILLYIMLGIFAQSLCIIRQIIALGFILIAITILSKKRWYISLLLIVIASLFHITAILAVVIIPFKFFKLNNYSLFFIVTFTLILSVLSPYILKFVDSITPLNYYEKYFNPNNQNAMQQIQIRSTLLNNLYTIGIVFVFFTLFFLNQYYKTNKVISRDYDFFLSIFLFVVLFRLVGLITSKNELFNRLTVYFFISLIILIPMFCNLICQKYKYATQIKLFVYAAALVYMFYIYVVIESCGVVPYSFM